MTDERRRAVRVGAPAGIEATVSGVPVRIIDLSMIGARVEHEERFPLASAHLHVAWRGSTASLPVRAARSEIIGKRESRLVYATGIQFIDPDPFDAEVIETILADAQSGSAPKAEAEPRPPLSPVKQDESLEDSWIRQVFTRDDEEDLPYSQFRMTERGWEKSYVATPQQPENGFTIERGDMEFHELQKTFESADPDTRRMMQIALESKLMAKK